MAGLTPAHLLIILVIALIVIGPGKLPEVGAAIGKSFREFQKASNGILDPLQQAQQTQPAPPAPVQPVAPMPVAQPPAQSYYAAQPGYQAPYAPQPGYAPQQGYAPQPGYAPPQPQGAVYAPPAEVQPVGPQPAGSEPAGSQGG